MTRVLIDAANLRVGGGVQVAASFLDELADLVTDEVMLARFPWLSGTTVEVSPTVAADASESTGAILQWHVCDRKPLQLARWVPTPRAPLYDVSFVVFGPEYGLARARRRIAGFADVTSVYPRPPELVAPSWRRRARGALRGMASRRLFLSAEVIVVETTAMAEHLCRRMGITPGSVRVVSNTYNRIFDEPERWLPPPPAARNADGEHVLIYVARGYPHKNLDFLGKLGEALDRSGTRVRFLVTLTDDEWKARSNSFRIACRNLGPLPLHAVPHAYQLATAAIFPSLLEAFSAMPVEAMRMGKPVFASDRDFVRTICGDVPLYIDPSDPISAAETIAAALGDPEQLVMRGKAGRELAEKLPTAKDRAIAYVKLIDEQVACLETTC